MSGSGQALASARVDGLGDRFLDGLLHGAELVVGQVGVLAHPDLEAAHRVGRGPAIVHLGRHVGRIVMHCVALHAQRHQLECGGPAARARALDRRARLAVDGEHVGAVDDDALEPVRRPARGQRGGGEVEVRRRGVGELVVVDHEHDREPPHAGEVHRLVRRAVGRRAVAEPAERDARLTAHAERERGADGDRQDRGQVGRPREDADAGRDVLGAQVGVAAVGRPAHAAHVLAEHAPRLDAAVEVQAEVAVQRRRHVLGRHGRRHADRGRLVALAGVERPGQLALLVEHVPALVEAPREQQRMQDAQERVAVESERSRLLEPASGLRSPHARNRHAASVAITPRSGSGPQRSVPGPQHRGQARSRRTGVYGPVCHRLN